MPALVVGGVWLLLAVATFYHPAGEPPMVGPIWLVSLTMLVIGYSVGKHSSNA